MTVFDVTKNSAICVLPWVHKFTDIEGDNRPCCFAKKTHDIQQVRDQMRKGTKPISCAGCYKSEQESGWSQRLRQTKEWLHKFSEPDIKNPQVQYLDVRFDPTCNLKCKTCNPNESTLWQKEKKIKIPRVVSNKKYFESINKKILKKVYLAGGEPTFIPTYLQFLEELYMENRECEVIINSNLKRLPARWKDIIKKFPRLSITCSCDAINELGTYVRYPLDWEQFEQNVKFASENANFFQFNLVASNLTTHKIDTTCNWMKIYSKNINLAILQTPKPFSEMSVPVVVRDVYLESLEKIQKFPVGLYHATQFRTQVKYLVKKYSDTKYSKDLHDQLKSEITEQDSHRRLKLRDIDGFLYNWIYNKY